MSRDKRAYFQTDVGYFDNPKLADLVEDHPRAVILHLRAIAYCAQHLTDGIFPMRLVMRLACASQCDFDLLVQCGLFYVLDDTRAEVHDYLKHQRPAETVKKAKAAGRKGAEARWQRHREAKADANRIADRNAEPNAQKERKKDITSEASTEARPDVERICNHLADRIEANGSKRPRITKTWRDEARRLIDLDGRTEEQITRAIDWAQDQDRKSVV